MSTLCWDCNEDDVAGSHASLCYDDVASSGPAARPLDFPAPTVFRCERVDIPARDHRSGTVHYLRNVIVRTDHDALRSPADTAYLVKKKIAKSVYGSVRLCIVLKRCSRTNAERLEQRQDGSADCYIDEVEWESTDLQVVIKVSEFSRMHAMRGRHLEDPIREISAMQLMGNYNPHVVGSLEVLQDENHLYCVMPHLSGGDLYGRLLECSPTGYPGACPDTHAYAGTESQARVWFRQLLQAVFHLQKKGVCHRDISLENIILDAQDRLVLIDHGLSLRVPYSDPCNPGSVTDASAGTCRRLMVSQGHGGKLMYAAPEIVERQHYVDPFATDMWSVGVVLFVMTVGMAPFKWAHKSDTRYAKMSQGGLKDLLKALDIAISPELTDLLQGFFWSDPRQRWTLAEVMNHPWIQGQQFVDATLSSVAEPPSFRFQDFETRKLSKGHEGQKSMFRQSFGRPRVVPPRM